MPAVRTLLRDLEELLAERSVEDVTVYLWVQKFTPELIDAATGLATIGSWTRPT